MLESIKWKDNNLQIIDQTLLPLVTKYINVKNVEDGWQIINKMQIRGAPAIAIAGCLSLAVELHNNSCSNKNELCQEIQSKLKYLVSARPTAVNMKNASNELTQLAQKLSNDDTVSIHDMKQRFIARIEKIFTDDVVNNKIMGSFGAKQIISENPNKVKVLTHCNTGSLATAGYGTALGVISSLFEMNHLEHVFCTETRPYNQGARLTAYELVYGKIPSTLICDDMVGAAMKVKNINVVIVGADRIAANGDTANKIGTYQIAILAKYHKIPFYVAAPITTIDFHTKTGNDIIIEERSHKEITHINNIQIAANGINCWNPSFDITPSELITAFITERGIFKPDNLHLLKEFQ